MNSKITFEEYLAKGKTFIIPDYQRGYIWGKKAGGSYQADAVTHMIDTLLAGFKHEQREIFIQGVTVSEKEREIELIDGQQRTTFFYLLLKWLGYAESFKIEYRVRDASQRFLEELVCSDPIHEPSREEKYQDCYFFKKSLHIIDTKLKDLEDREAFLEYILDKVSFLYITIPSDKAMITFSMMNGNKAQMQREELIKAELLRLASLCSVEKGVCAEERYAYQWESEMLRSRYAREWDRWLQWWNREEVRNLYQTNTLLGLLPTTLYQQKNTPAKTFGFEDFRQQFMAKQQSKEAKDVFYRLRSLQKRFEDAFHNPKTYNYIGAILRVLNNKEEREKFISWYFLDEKKTEKVLKSYYLLAFLGLTHKEIEENNQEKIKEKFELRLAEIEDNFSYQHNREAVFRLLLRLNIDEDNLQEEGRGRKFDFSIWDKGRSLEHIYPKSKVVHTEKEGEKERMLDGSGKELCGFEIDDTYIRREECKDGDEVASEHSIGNLVLLYKNENSMFSNSSFEEKKSLFFKKGDKEIELFKSRHLLHTIYVFAHSQWKGKDIAQNKKRIIEAFNTTYHQYITSHD